MEEWHNWPIPPDADARLQARRIAPAEARRLGFGSASDDDPSNAPSVREGTTMIPHRTPAAGEWLDQPENLYNDGGGQTVATFCAHYRHVTGLQNRDGGGGEGGGEGGGAGGGEGGGEALTKKKQKRGARLRRRRQIVLVPLDGEEEPQYRRHVVNRSMLQEKELRTLAEFLRIFLQFPDDGVKMLPTMSMAALAKQGGRRIKTRKDTNEEGTETYMQFDLKGVLANLSVLREKDEDAFSVIGLTPSLLYYSEWPDCRYLEGLANTQNPHAAFGFFTMPNKTKSMLRRGTFSVMCHEVCHTLGILHCIYYDTCFMRGATDHEESLDIPLICCPVELNKLRLISGPFDVMDRYRQLYTFYNTHRMTRERNFVKRRMADVEAMEATEAAGRGVAEGAAREGTHSKEGKGDRSGREESGGGTGRKRKGSS
jgi:hypothetical protein